MATAFVDQITGNGETVAYKAPCRVASTANVVLSGLLTVDGVTLAANDRVLVKNQTDAKQNGIYIVSSGPWQRARDLDSNRDVTRGTKVFVVEGTYENREFTLTTANPISVGSSEITFALADDVASAAASAAAAAESETNAAASATTATEKATAASGSADDAAGSATAAAGSASDASDSASAAATDKATVAADKATVAGYKADAEAAKTAAETAKSAAETAEDNASVSATAAATSELNAALSAQDAADTAATLASTMVIKGTWDASTGSFPSGTIKTGYGYVVTAAGTVDGVDFSDSPPDMLYAIKDNPSATTMAGNWIKFDFSDLVSSVAGLKGAITAAALHTALSIAAIATSGSASDLSSGEVPNARLPSRLRSVATAVANWNTVTDAGWYYSSPGAGKSAPNDTDWFSGRVDPTGFSSYVSQTVRAYVAPIPNNGKTYRRFLINNAWSAWLPVYLTQAEQATLWTSISDLASTDAGKGAALVGIEAIASLPGVVDVQAALAALASAAGGSAGLATAWVNFDGTGTPSIKDSYNVASITDNSTGNWTVNFATPMANSNFAAVVSAGVSSGAVMSRIESVSVDGVTVSVRNTSGGAADASFVSVVVFGGK